MQKEPWDDPMMEMIDTMDARNSRSARSKASSIEKLRRMGYSDAEIEQLLNVRL